MVLRVFDHYIKVCQSCLNFCDITHFMVLFLLPALSEKSLCVKYFTCNLNDKVTLLVSLLALSSVSAWSGINNLPFPSKFQLGQTQMCPQFTPDDTQQLLRVCETAFPRCWKGIHQWCSRNTTQYGILFARWPHKKGQQTSSYGFEWVVKKEPLLPTW